MPDALRILALEPYYGGSHRAFLDGWQSHSRHHWHCLTLPARHWKWRMRHAAVTLAKQCEQLEGSACDVLWCSDMLGLAEFSGLCPNWLKDCPKVLYFHENQLSYPNRVAAERDHHFGFTNFTSALAADQLWFNSSYHQGDFFACCRDFLARMPDYQPLAAIRELESRSQVQSPGVSIIAARTRAADQPLHIVWAARWEHDKNPHSFFEALRIFKEEQGAFRLSVLGEQFRDVPEVFAQARSEFADHIDRWGFLPGRDEFEQALANADVFVSSADHEFFGLAAVEAVLAGCFPLLPQRLAYPGVLQLDRNPHRQDFFYDGSSRHLARRLQDLAERHTIGGLTRGAALQELRRSFAEFHWDKRAAEMDDALRQLV